MRKGVFAEDMKSVIRITDVECMEILKDLSAALDEVDAWSDNPVYDEVSVNYIRNTVSAAFNKLSKKCGYIAENVE